MEEKNCCSSKEGQDKCSKCCCKKPYIMVVVALITLTLVFSMGYLFGKIKGMYKYGFGRGHDCPMKYYNQGYGKQGNYFNRGQQMPIDNQIEPEEILPAPTSTNQ